MTEENYFPAESWEIVGDEAINAKLDEDTAEEEQVSKVIPKHEDIHSQAYCVLTMFSVNYNVNILRM